MTLRAHILALARRYDFEEGHALQDERLALRLFDELTRLGLLPYAPALLPAEAGCAPRDLLSYAAILHDIGYVEGYDAHHKTAFRLIMAAPIAGLSPRSQALVAHIARYHRGSLPDPTQHAAFAALSRQDQALVCQLGAILRFADGLDRSHTCAVHDLHCRLDGLRLSVTLLPGVADADERWAGQKKARWLEAVYSVQVEISQN